MNITPASRKPCRLQRAQVTRKGARPMVKLYTDLHASAADVRSWYGVGLEPTIGLVGFPCGSSPKALPPQEPCGAPVRAA